MSKKKLKRTKLPINEDIFESNKVDPLSVVPSQTLKQMVTEFGKDFLIGIVSWNIGHNVTQAKMNELIREYMYTFEISPDILIVAFQELPVTVGLRGTRHAFKTFYKTTGDMIANVLTDYQIMDTYESRIDSTTKTLNAFTCANMFSRIGGGYAIATYIFKRKSLPIPVVAIDIGDNCDESTKGHCVITLKIANQKLDIINTHMPFKDEQKTKKFAQQMLDKLYYNEFDSESQIILGDLNSRSLLTKDCYAKDITVCGDEDESKYCYLKEKLEALSLEESIQNENSYSSIGIRKLTDDNCDIADRLKSKKRLSHDEGKYKTSIQDMIKILLKSDVLHVKMKELFPGFKESNITFLPTYKRDETSGLFSLIKKENQKVHGRLPGYADRILCKGRYIKVGSNYSPLKVLGNDHLPISTLVTLRLHSTHKVTKPQKTQKLKRKLKVKLTTKPKPEPEPEPEPNAQPKSDTKPDPNKNKEYLSEEKKASSRLNSKSKSRQSRADSKPKRNANADYLPDVDYSADGKNTTKKGGRMRIHKSNSKNTTRKR